MLRDLPPTTCDYSLGIARSMRNASRACRRKNERRTVADMRAEAAQAPRQSGGFPPNSGVDTQQVGQHMDLRLTLPGRGPPKTQPNKGLGVGVSPSRLMPSLPQLASLSPSRLAATMSLDKRNRQF